MDILAEMRAKTSSQTPGDQGLVRQRIPGGSVSKTTEISSCHQSRLLQQLDEQRRQELFCDCSVMVEGKLFKAHRNVLFASSGYFRMLLSHGAQDCGKVVSASFEVFSPETFTVILDFVYSGHLDLTSHNVIEVMSAASYLQMTDVIGYCKTFIKSSLDISAKDDEDRYLSLSENGLQAGSESLLYTSDNVSSVLKNTNSSTSSHLSSSWRACNSGTQQDYQQSGGSKELKQENSHSLVPSPTEVLDFKTGNPRPGRPPVDPDSRLRQHSAASADDAEAESPNSFQYSPSSDGVLGGGKKMNWSGSSGTSEMKGTPSRPKAEKADELYATLPTIVGVVGLFNKDECPTMRFKCPFCTHTVKRKADLKRHLRCHTGERPYPCEACGKRFTRLEHLRSHFQTIHQARKLICRKCKRQVTELSGRVVCEGTRRYRLCHECLMEAGCDNMVLDLPNTAGQSAAQYFDEDKGWPVTDDDDLAEDSGTDLIIQEVEDSEDESEQKEVKPMMS